ncbi:General secretion pathway, M protein [Marinomonas aquimarina]|uniref:General secretion pathway, M protein n=1 Tax=Marinomonas aquimarina TaxID=295068 RepID=A0A1A8TIX6_9GAMM|nr:type II secretion system protein GspM [Marinomonas aquimarina]SBS32453.1 General secretion pathway, M protein [Marinomonas aquimarina]
MKGWLMHQYEQSHGLQKSWHWYRARTGREQLLLRCAGILLLALSCYWLLLSPLLVAQSEAELRLTQAQQQYQTLQMQAQQLMGVGQGERFEDRDNDALRRILAQTAAKAQFSADRVMLDGDSRLQIWAADVPFVRVASWLNGLAQERVAIHQLQLERVSEGQVDLRITLD